MMTLIGSIESPGLVPEAPLAEELVASSFSDASTILFKFDDLVR